MRFKRASVYLGFFDIPCANVTLRRKTTPALRCTHALYWSVPTASPT